MNLDVKIKDFASAIICSAQNQVLKKAVFSKSKNKSIVKTVADRRLKIRIKDPPTY